MLRLKLIVVAVLIYGVNLSQQNFGIYAGSNLSEFNGREDNISNYKPMMGYEIGGFYMIPIHSKFSIKQTAGFSNRTIGYDNPAQYLHQYITLNSISLTSAITYNGNDVSLTFGPSVFLLLNHNSIYTLEQNKFKTFNKADIGLSFGITKPICNNVGIHLSYFQGVVSSNKTFQANSEEKNISRMREYSKVLSVGLNYTF